MSSTFFFCFPFSIDINNSDSAVLQDIWKWKNNKCLFKKRQCLKFILQQINAIKYILKMVVSCLSAVFWLTFYINVLLCVLLYRKEIIPEELLPLYLAVTYWHLDLQVLISTSDFPRGVNINDSRKKKCCCMSSLQPLYQRPILVNPLIMDKLSGCLMLPSSQKCRALSIRMASSFHISPYRGRSYHPKPLLSALAWSTIACGLFNKKYVERCTTYSLE